MKKRNQGAVKKRLDPYAKKAGGLVLTVLLAVSVCFISQIALADDPSSAPSSGSSTSNSAANGESYTTDDYWASKAMVNRLLRMANDPELDEAQRAAVEEALKSSTERLSQIESELARQAAATAAEDAAAAARIAAAEAAAKAAEEAAAAARAAAAAAAAEKCTDMETTTSFSSIRINEPTRGPSPAQGMAWMQGSPSLEKKTHFNFVPGNRKNKS